MANMYQISGKPFTRKFEHANQDAHAPLVGEFAASQLMHDGTIRNSAAMPSCATAAKPPK